MNLTRMYLGDSTIGRLEAGNFKCFTLELPWKDNEPNISCIPEGTYDYSIDVSPSRGIEVIWIEDVKDRSSIQVHPGNYTRQIRGCILVGDGIKDIDNDGCPDVTNSIATLKKLLSAIPRTGTITIKGSSA